MEHRHAAHLVHNTSGAHTPEHDEGAKAVQEHPAVISRLTYSVRDMFTPERVQRQRIQQDAFRAHISQSE
jgi:hypothetical protein